MWTLFCKQKIWSWSNIDYNILGPPMIWWYQKNPHGITPTVKFDKHNGLSCFSVFRLHSSVLVKGPNATGCKDILANWALLTLWQQFAVPTWLCREQSKTRLDKFCVEELHWHQASTPLNTFGRNHNAHWEPGLLVQHRYLTPQMVSWLSGHQFPQTHSKFLWKALPEEWWLCYS